VYFFFYKDFSFVINNRNKDTLILFGKQLRKLRLEKKISQEELNFKAELSKNMVGLIERGEVNPTLSTLENLAFGLDISLKELVDF
jgi:transcriptional regulator with XRE-family HTH domain